MVHGVALVEVSGFDGVGDGAVREGLVFDAAALSGDEHPGVARVVRAERVLIDLGDGECGRCPLSEGHDGVVGAFERIEDGFSERVVR